MFLNKLFFKFAPKNKNNKNKNKNQSCYFEKACDWCFAWSHFRWFNRNWFYLKVLCRKHFSTHAKVLLRWIILFKIDTQNMVSSTCSLHVDTHSLREIFFCPPDKLSIFRKISTVRLTDTLKFHSSNGWDLLTPKWVSYHQTMSWYGCLPCLLAGNTFYSTVFLDFQWAYFK